jgi:hypothetical protein
MQGDSEEWKRLCEQAAKEQDPEKLITLTRRITELLDQRLHTARHDKGREASQPRDVRREAE